MAMANFFNGAQASAMTAVTGGGVNYVASLAQSKVDFLNKNPWIMPAALFLTGHALKRGKAPGVGQALLTLSGVAAVNSLVTTNMVPAPAALFATAPTVKGYYGDAGVLLDPSDVRQLAMTSSYGAGYADAGVVLQPVASADAMGL
jgi:hypothetical protein